jgi:hypothetical protein
MSCYHDCFYHYHYPHHHFMSRFHIWAKGITFVFLTLAFLLNMVISSYISFPANKVNSLFIHFYAWIILHCVYLPYILYPFISFGACRMIS